MLKNKEPKRGSFDYLLDGNSFHNDPPPPSGGPPRRVVVNIEITERRRDRERPGQGGFSLFLVVGIVAGLLLAAAHVL
jgi:hypothetical protein